MSFLVERRLRLWAGALILLYVVLVGRFLACASTAPRRTDFAQFWAAAVVAREEGAGAVYDLDRLGAAERRLMGPDFPTLPFNYPPPYLLLVLPLGLLPLLAGWCLWTAAGVALFAGAMCRSAPHPLTPWLALAFPGVILNVSYGQNGLFLAAAVAAGWTLLGARPLAAGLLLSLLTVKPQLALAVPLALVAGRRWRALAGFVLGTAALTLAATAVLGPSSWEGFVARLSATQRYVDANPVLLGLHASVGSSLRALGLSFGFARLGQLLATLAAGLAVVVASRRHAGRPDLTGAAATAGGLVMAPYLVEYDLALLGPVVAWMAMDGASRGSLTGPLRGLLVLLWLVPFAGRHVASVLGASPAALLALVVLAVLVCSVPPSVTGRREGSRRPA